MDVTAELLLKQMEQSHHEAGRCSVLSFLPGHFFHRLFYASSQICGSFSARAGVQGHIKMHHAHTNVIGLGDSSVWKVPFLPRSVYLFLAPLTVPVITPLVALGKDSGQPMCEAEPPVLPHHPHSGVTSFSQV